MERIPIASDHAGCALKEELKKEITALGFEPVDMGTNGDESVDYPDYGEKVAGKVSSGEFGRGVLICGTGIGMCIVANKFPGVRAALVGDVETAVLSREHNDANILVVGARKISADAAKQILKAWLKTAFAAGRHARRVEKISELEKRGK